MAEFVYILCTLTSFICAWLLFRAYRANKTALLFWSSILSRVRLPFRHIPTGWGWQDSNLHFLSCV